MEVRLIAQGRVQGGATLATSLSDAIADKVFDRLDVAVAYATTSGIIALEKAIGAFPMATRWAVGLDDAITQPEAIETIRQMPGATLRLSTLASQGRRFHPKIYCLWSSIDPVSCILSVGSGNMTLNGLRKNGEVAAILTATSPKESAELKAIWSEMWELSVVPDQTMLDAYRDRFAVARKARKAVTAAGAAPPDPVPGELVEENLKLDGSPKTAKHAWLDVGSATAQGREVELPKAMVPYFKANDNSFTPITLRLRQTGTNKVNLLPFTRREDNGMWRIGFTSAVVNSSIGRSTFKALSGGNRSDLALAFTRTGKNSYDIEFNTLASVRYSELKAKSVAIGAHHRTLNTPAGRSFGFF